MNISSILTMNDEFVDKSKMSEYVQVIHAPLVFTSSHVINDAINLTILFKEDDLKMLNNYSVRCVYVGYDV